MIGFAMTNASALVAPALSKERMLGTNPIAVAIPAGKQPPFGRLCHHYGGKRKTGDPAAEKSTGALWMGANQRGEPSTNPLQNSNRGGAMHPWEATGNMEATKGLC